MVIIGIVIHERNVSNGKSSIEWWVWFLWFGGLIIAVIGGIWVAWIYHKKGKQKSIPPGNVFQAKPVTAAPAAVVPINNPVIPVAPAPTVQTNVQTVPQTQYVQQTVPQQIALTPLPSTLVQAQAPPVVQQPTSVTANVVQVPHPTSNTQPQIIVR